ncbi:YybH family protein [Endozoicomonas lisbonensis]|uniref:Ketosteroid isomerase-like protein n=1 Tax=Endozoicomonas lisbonensis TaxID=3120522 RepID=A0ABV2SKM2_9GAMM
MSTRLEGEALAPFLHIIRQYERCIKDKDVDGMMSLFVDDNEPHSFGLHVNLNSRSDIEQRYNDYFSSEDGFVSETEAPVVYLYGEAACMCTQLNVKGYDHPKVRVTAFLENHSGKWLIRHQHFSPSPE